jgi:pyruvate carboxylase subunit B
MPSPLERIDTTRHVGITDVTIRDGHQCLLATRMRTDDMLTIAEQLDDVGFWSIEMWGGATFDSCLRFLQEDPWQRLKLLREAMPKTPFQMLLRGQNLVGYRHYPDDVVEKFIEVAAVNGMDIFRIFDALNDIRNLEVPIRKALQVGAYVEGAVCYTQSPVHTPELFVDMARKLEDMGCQVICLKDMAGLLSPGNAYRIIGALKQAVDVPVHLHSHDTSGMAVATLLKAIEAGVDIVDTAISTMAGGTSHAPTETMVAILDEGERPTGLEIDKLETIAKEVRELRKHYAEFESEFSAVDPKALHYQVPGGMISNLANQLREQGALDRMVEVMAEVPHVRKDMGYPPLVTPSSQIVGTQATLNVLTGERYKSITAETKNYFRGLYGQSAAPKNLKVQKMIIGDEEPFTGRPADLLEPELDKAREEINDLATCIEDVISYAVFPKQARDYLQARADGTLQQPMPPGLKQPAETAGGGPIFAPTDFRISVHGEEYHVQVGGAGRKGDDGRRPFFLYVDGQLEEVLIETLQEIVPSQEGKLTAAPRKEAGRPQASEDGDITTSMPGTVVRVLVSPGDEVNPGDTVLVVEAMKMENEIHTPVAGKVEELFAAEGDAVSPGETLVRVR